jgi:hypothetical protein
MQTATNSSRLPRIMRTLRPIVLRALHARPEYITPGTSVVVQAIGERYATCSKVHKFRSIRAQTFSIDARELI